MNGFHPKESEEVCGYSLGELCFHIVRVSVVGISAARAQSTRAIVHHNDQSGYGRSSALRDQCTTSHPVFCQGILCRGGNPGAVGDSLAVVDLDGARKCGCISGALKMTLCGPDRANVNS